MKRRVSLHLLSLLLLTCVVAAGCEFLIGNHDDDSSNQPLAGPTWELGAIENADGEVTFRQESDQTYQITFAESGRLAAQNACNNCCGEYEVSGSSISIAASCTEAACGAPAPYLGYGDALTQAVAYEIEGDELRIRSVDREGDEQTLVHVSEQE